jgi:5-methyltetrahydropteroyltriglutamate--homocysteine methyltransferase
MPHKIRQNQFQFSNGGPGATGNVLVTRLLRGQSKFLRAPGFERDVLMSKQYRVDHVGSLLRPAELIQARVAFGSGQITLERLRKLEDQAIGDILEMQRQAGVEVFSDGEYRRGLFLDVLTEAVEGFVPGNRSLTWRAGGGATEVVKSGKVVGGKLRQKGRLAGHEAAFLKENCPGPFKITLPTPAQFMLASYQEGVTDQVYPSRAELTNDLVAILRSEINALAEEGVPYIQMDAPSFTDFLDERYRARMTAEGLDPERALDEALAASNACFAGVERDGITLAVHLCRGNQRSR